MTLYKSNTLRYNDGGDEMKFKQHEKHDGSNRNVVLFDEVVPTHVTSTCESRTSNVHINISVVSSSDVESKKILHVRLTDDSDPFFLYTLNLSEIDFQRVKKEQSLLVDFPAFADSVTDLLNKCLHEAHEAPPNTVPKFLATFVEESTKYRLDLVETNAFKHLTHLSLELIPGSDSDVKKYLASCLRRLTATNEQLVETVSLMEDRLASTNNQLEISETAVDSLRKELVEEGESCRKKHDRELEVVRSSLISQREAAETEIRHNHDDIVTSLQKRGDEMEERASTLDAQLTGLKAEFVDATQTIEQLRTRCALGDEQAEAAGRAIEALKKENKALDVTLHEQEKEISRLLALTSSLEQQVHDKGELLERANVQIESLEGQRKQSQDTCDLYKSQNAQLEESMKGTSREIAKGNEIIQKLQKEVQSYQTKVKFKNTVTIQQEELLSERQRTLRDHELELEHARTLLAERDHEFGAMRAQLEEAVANFEESQKKLRNNENVIAWLNKQMTETALNVHHGMTGYNSSSGNAIQGHIVANTVSGVNGEPTLSHSNGGALPSLRSDLSNLANLSRLHATHGTMAAYHKHTRPSTMVVDHGYNTTKDKDYVESSTQGRRSQPDVNKVSSKLGPSPSSNSSPEVLQNLRGGANDKHDSEGIKARDVFASRPIFPSAYFGVVPPSQ